MKRSIQSVSLALIFLLVLPCGLVATQAQDVPPPPPANDYFPGKWKAFSSTEGRFTVRFPNQPQEGSKVYDSYKGKVTLHSLFYGNSSFIFYSVDYRDYPEAP